MEVHHHTHLASGETHSARKKWMHYFWEFLMLFLAVFCGFLAEYQLEHKIEKNREKQFMVSMIEDLKSDTSVISTLNQRRKERLRMYDSINTAIIEKKYSENGSGFYYWGRNISRRVFFFSSDGTMQQLKNSGGLRLISDHSISEKIIAYDVLYRRTIIQQELEELLLNEYRLLARRVFDAAVFNQMMKPTIVERSASGRLLKDSSFALLTPLLERPAGNPQLKDDSETLLNELANQLNYWAATSDRLLEHLEQMKEMAADLIEIITKKYKLK